MEHPLVVLAGGTDLSAFLGMLEELAERGGAGSPCPVTNARDLCEVERLEAYAARIEHFSQEVALMNPAPECQGKTGLGREHLPVCCAHASLFTSMRGMTFRLETTSGQRAIARQKCLPGSGSMSGRRPSPI
ncbi:hypothetical protein Q8F57_046240 [Paraburkholderia terrae]|uniref:hypothetical protein n=1 Tax=Paraburkholderia terrae TaxID=311230 RepID=UPI00296AD7FA|nr:hypothetical protein [Paraburkholderia terrae]MDW3658616.1 hypothetical protein [Paraburkholderia terrae]